MTGGEHPWLGIDLDVYERHMSDPGVGQLQRLREITSEQLSAHRARTIGILGIAGGNGLDLIDPHSVDGVYGYDINARYLAACAARYRSAFGDRLHLRETELDRTVRIEPVELLIANLLVEYVGVSEFGAFVAANHVAVGRLSCVVQRSERAGFVSATRDTSAFDGLAAVSSDVDPERLASELDDAGFLNTLTREYSLPNGKSLIRQDFAPRPRPREASSSGAS